MRGLSAKKKDIDIYFITCVCQPKTQQVMRNSMLTLLLVTIAFPGISQELEANAKYIKEKYSTDYTATIRNYAVKEWGDDYQMVVYEINQQCDALVELVNAFKSENTNIAYKAILEWSQDGYETRNSQEFQKIKVFGVEQLLKLHCDWQMVKYEYDNQVKAKNAF